MIHSKEIVNAIGVHGNWKQRLRRAIETGKSDFTVDELIVDNQCDFGKWLHSLSSDIKKSSQWSKIQQVHAKFHIEAARLFVFARQEKQKEVLDAMVVGSDFARYSSELTMAMVKWKNSITQIDNLTRCLDAPFSSITLPLVDHKELFPDTLDLRDASRRDPFGLADRMSVNTN